MHEDTLIILERLDGVSARFDKQIGDVQDRVSTLSSTFSRDLGQIEGRMAGHGNELSELKLQVRTFHEDLDRADERIDDRLRRHVTECLSERDRIDEARDQGEQTARVRSERTTKPRAKGVSWYNTTLAKVAFYVGVALAGGVATIAGTYGWAGPPPVQQSQPPQVAAPDAPAQ